MNLILDLDGTLVDHYTDDYNLIHVKARPHLSKFFKYVFTNFESVSIWTNGTYKWYRYVWDQVLNKHMPLVYCFTMVITYDDGLIVCKETAPKSLHKIYKIYPEQFNKKNTFLVDDSKHTLRNDPLNSFLIPTYNYDIDPNIIDTDNELVELITLLESKIQIIDRVS
jgi:hypothetical protein